MNYTLKLAIPLGLGLAAALVNMMVLKSRTNTVMFIKAADNISLGTTFTLNDLEELPLPGTLATLLKDTAIPYESLGVLVGQPALRDFMKGDIVFFRDFDLQGETLQLRLGEVAQQVSLRGVDISASNLQIGNEVNFLVQMKPGDPKVTIGPFRVVSIGDRVSNSLQRTSAGGVVGGITVAVKKQPNDEEKARQDLLDDFALQQQQDLATLVRVQIANE